MQVATAREYFRHAYVPADGTTVVANYAAVQASLLATKTMAKHSDLGRVHVAAYENDLHGRAPSVIATGALPLTSTGHAASAARRATQRRPTTTLSRVIVAESRIPPGEHRITISVSRPDVPPDQTTFARTRRWTLSGYSAL
jgi:hypothetical protein